VEPHTENFGARLRSLIDRKGLTLVEFAEQFPLSESNLHNWLKRSAPPLEKHWDKLAAFFGVSRSYVAYGAPILSELDADVPFGDGSPNSADEVPEEMRDLAWRIKTSLENSNYTAASLAAKMGTSVGCVHDWLGGKKRPKARELRDLAGLFDVDAGWLATGEKPASGSAAVVPPPPDSAVFVREVPVISWTHAGAAATYEEMPQHFHGKVATACRGRRLYGLRVEGDSMIPRYNPGDIVVLDAYGEPRNGKGVVVKFTTDAVQIRLYHKLSSGKIRLTSTRPEVYPTDDYDPSDFHWIHPVLQTVRDE
jgi:phage repressor protein C with HTH and peptisase S24 domain/lambda repressor-like predicted transcriptional regulator